MSFWIIALDLAALAVAPIILILRRDVPVREETDHGTHMGIYKDQLKEVERDLARGTLSESDAQRTRVEISRRMLDIDKKTTNSAKKSKRLPFSATVALGVLIVLSSAAVYNSLGAPRFEDLPLERRLALTQDARDTRISQSEAEQEFGQTRQNTPQAPQHLALISQLEEALQSRPNDLQGHMLLASNAAAIGKYRLAHNAQARVLSLKGGSATAQDYATYAENLILSVDGYVSPEAEHALSQSLALDAENNTASFYAGYMLNQFGRHDLAFKVWSKLLERSTQADPWTQILREEMEDTAYLAGELNYTLPPVVQSPDFLAPLKGPQAADIDAAAEMAPEDRAAFIQSMVDQLSARLANSGGTAQEWAQLISALGVLGDTARAAAIWGEAQVVFSGDTAALAAVRSAAQSAGVLQ